MELNVELNQTSNWQSVTDLYDVVFADDTNSSNTNTTSDNMSDTATVLSQFDGSTSYVTLKSPQYTQNFNHEENISSFLNEQIEKIEGRDSFDNATLGNLLSRNSKTLNSNWDGIPVSQINENAIKDTGTDVAFKMVMETLPTGRVSSVKSMKLYVVDKTRQLG